jgi:hypothetical protein
MKLSDFLKGDWSLNQHTKISIDNMFKEIYRLRLHIIFPVNVSQRAYNQLDKLRIDLMSDIKRLDI